MNPSTTKISQAAVSTKKSLPGTYIIFFAEFCIHEVDKTESEIGGTS